MINTNQVTLVKVAEFLDYDNLSVEQLTQVPQVTINSIQGTGLRSTLEGTTVTNVAGIVTVVALNGFYLQDPNPDNNAATSEGIFVFTSSRPTVSVGDSIQLDGRVVEFSSGGNQDNQPITQLDRTANITVLSTGNQLPEAIAIGAAGRNPPTESFYPEGGGIFFYESLEGMRVTVKDAMAVGATQNFATNAQIWTVSDQGKEATGINSRDGITISPEDFNPERILINDGLFRGLVREPGETNDRFTIPTVNVGDLSSCHSKCSQTG